MYNFLKVILYLAFSIIAFHFICANFSLMSPGNPRGIPTSTSAQLSETRNENDPINDQQKQEILKEMEAYSRKVMADSSVNSQEITSNLQNKYALKPKSETINNDRDGLLNKVLNYVSPVATSQSNAPSLDNFSDYAPTTLPIIKNSPILVTNKIVPNYLEIDKSNYHDQSLPMALNEFDTTADSDFKSENTQMSNVFSQKSMAFKSFDDISKSDIVDPSEWDRIAKKKEKQSPLLSMACMVQDSNGFLPKNHYEIGQTYSNII